MAALTPDFDSFSRLAAGCTRVPVVATLIGDELTPVAAYARLEADSPHAFLLESVVGGEKIARYSFLGAQPSHVVEVTRDRGRVRDVAVGGVREFTAHDPLLALQAELARYAVASLPGLPRFLGGAVGYAAYDTVRYYERLPHAPADDRNLPDLLFGIYDTLVIFDHARKLMMIVAHAVVPPGASPAALRRAYEAASERIAGVAARLARPHAEALRSVDAGAWSAAGAPGPLEQLGSNFERPAFEQAVSGCQEYIRAGDIFQVVLSQRLRLCTPAEPFAIYRALRVINPSPFMFCLKSPQVTLVGSSPEILCRVEDGVVTNRPLAGTRRRGADEAEDRRLAEELLADPKERAEHIMLVDLGRNDVGRVCEPSTVRVSDVLSVERYSHVMHLCSQVTGRLAAGKTAFDALRAALPVGTVSGAPKVRAMEIIDQFEPTRRGPYAGAVGYVDFAGGMDTCIALRTLVLRPAPGGGYTADAQVGAGIVADSTPAGEYEETINKARGMLAAVRLAERTFADSR